MSYLVTASGSRVVWLGVFCGPMQSEINQIVEDLNFQFRLSWFIDTAFDYEQEFLANFWEWDPDKAELLEFYMANDKCKVVVVMSDGRTVTSTINTDEYIEWTNDIRDSENN